MKMSINSMLLITTLSVAMWGCAAADTVVGVDPANVKVAAANANAVTIVSDTASQDSSKFDFFRDHSFEIKEEVQDARAEAVTMQNEIDRVTKIAKKYSEYTSMAVTEEEKQIASGLARSVWECELNTLCARAAGISDAKKEKLLNDQKNWSILKDEVVSNYISEGKDGKEADKQLASEYLETVTKNRCIILAKAIADSREDEEFEMPERSVYGTFADSQDNADMLSSFLITRKADDGTNVALISIHQMALLEGTFKDKGNGELEFIGNRNNIKGTIKLDGWEGATLEITNSSDEIYNVGLHYTFDLAF